MNVRIATGDLLEQRVDAIVNTVNTVGVMGKGIALQFKRKWPENFKAYERAVADGAVSVGKMFVFDNGGLVTPHFIINFPTKEHWRSKSRVEFIQAGLDDLVAVVQRLGIRSIAIPPLGCGNGGLDWQVVRPLIEEAFRGLTDVDVRLFEPNQTARLRELAADERAPTMTPGRAAMIAVIYAYQRMLYTLSMLEVQKLAYFLAVSGEPLNLDYQKDKFGPYSPKLRHVLLKMDGAYIRGVGDLNAKSEIEVLPGAIDAAAEFFRSSGKEETMARVQRVFDLIEGYETPYGLELLATVHWASNESPATTSVDEVSRRVTQWNERKRQIMPPVEIADALSRLRELGWAA
ncbi:MAG TPA: macro domain-containing protein [Terricaulis sp.]|nr:macro domain-containing protein [Terricaulis sp.]